MKRYRYLILSITLTALCLYSQNKSRPAVSDQKSFELKALERQLSYTAASEKRGDIGTAYNSYLQLIKKYETDPRVISGFLDLSIRVNKIRECEIKLKETAKKYPVKQTYTDSKIETDAFPLRILGFLAEFFIRTNREDQAFQIFEQIEKANTSKQFISELKAYAFYRAGSFGNAEKIFLSLRKDMKDEKAYSNELYYIYLGSERIAKSINELLKMVVGTDEQNKINIDISAFNPEAELFRLFETAEFKDSILQAAEKLPRNEKNSTVLSELYFNSGSYDKAYEVVKNSGSYENNDMLIADFAVRLYSEKKYTEAASFFELSLKNSRSPKEDDFINLYVKCLELSNQTRKAVQVLIESSLKDKDIILAEIFHNKLDSISEADRLYKKNLTNNKNHSEYWKDYIRLKIALKDYKTAQLLLKKVFDEQIMDIFTNVSFYEFKYMEAILALFSNDINSFRTKSDQMIRDDYISDFDNDLLKISSDIEAVGDDDALKEIYLGVLSHKIDRKTKLGDGYKNTTAEMSHDRQTVIIETNLYIFISINDAGKAAEIITEAAEKRTLNNNMAKMFAEYSKEHRKDEKINSVLILLLKSGIGEELKTEIREIIREKQPS